MGDENFDVIIAGGGISGLAAARHLVKAGLSPVIIEADSRIGGRIKSDHLEGFILDHGFQVLQTAYPEARRQLDLDALELGPFMPGVSVRLDNRLHFLSDPLRNPAGLWSTLTAPVGTLGDRLRMLKLLAAIRRKGPGGVFQDPDIPTPEFLRSQGFSPAMIHRFFRPFFAGACLDPDIMASSRVFQYLFNIFASGDAALPARGMGAVPAQLAGPIPDRLIRLNTRVLEREGQCVRLSTGETVCARAIVLATDAHAAARLLDRPETPGFRGEACLYFKAPKPPLPKPFLVLNGEGNGPVDLVALPSLAAPSYAPDPWELVAAIVLSPQSINGQDSDPDLAAAVQAELAQWFGPDTALWEHIKTFHIPRALPDQSPPLNSPFTSRFRLAEGLYHCGELDAVPGIQWALRAGRKTAEQILRDLRFTP